LGELSLSPTLAPHFRNGDNLAAGSALPRPFHSLSILPLSSEQELKNKVSKKKLKNKEELERKKEKRRKGRERKENQGVTKIHHLKEEMHIITSISILG
jgi:hypothetical protein